MAAMDFTVKPKPDDIFVIFSLIPPTLSQAKHSDKGVSFCGEFINGAALLKYAIEALGLTKDATLYEIVNAFPAGQVFLQLVNPCARE